MVYVLVSPQDLDPTLQFALSTLKAQRKGSTLGALYSVAAGRALWGYICESCKFLVEKHEGRHRDGNDKQHSQNDAENMPVTDEHVQVDAKI